jgi:protein transport protein SEC13
MLDHVNALQVYQSPATLHSASINSLCWAPHEVGLVLATASSDGTIGIIEHSNGNWTTSKVSCPAAPWCP